MKPNNIASWLITTTIILFALIYGQMIILPFLIAILIWFVVKKTRNLLDKNTLIQKYVPSWVKTLLASLVIFAGIFTIGKVLSSNIENLAQSYALYAENIEVISIKINELLNINLSKEMTNFVQNFDFTSHLEQFFNSISELLSNMIMLIFYVTFIFVEESLFEHKIKLMFTDSKQYESVQSTLKKVDKSMSSYISLKSLISLLSTTLSYFILLAVGIESPLFWAFLIFVLNFIPSVGPIIGTLLPALFSLIQFGEFVPFLVILFGVGAVAMLIGSLVEPRLMGNTLNISPLVAILSLAIWGSIWGIVGMFLSVPITVAMIIVFSQFPSTRSIAILLSEKGRV
ncbi:MAG: AI-2E family transporter [Crocinitomicaceae bacterium]|nr:AI-2E family transporter [Crocinitomicaceae bacterium]